MESSSTRKKKAPARPRAAAGATAKGARKLASKRTSSSSSKGRKGAAKKTKANLKQDMKAQPMDMMLQNPGAHPPGAHPPGAPGAGAQHGTAYNMVPGNGQGQNGQANAARDAYLRQRNAFVQAQAAQAHAQAQAQAHAHAQQRGRGPVGNSGKPFDGMPLTIPPLNMNTYSNGNIYQQQQQRQRSHQSQRRQQAGPGPEGANAPPHGQNPYLHGAQAKYNQAEIHGHANGGPNASPAEFGYEMGQPVDGSVPPGSAEFSQMGQHPNAHPRRPNMMRDHPEAAAVNDEKLVAQAVARALMESNVMNSAEHVKIAQNVAMRVFEVFKHKIRALNGRINQLQQQMLHQDARPPMQYQSLLNPRHSVPGGLQSGGIPYGMNYQAQMASPNGVMNPGAAPMKNPGNVRANSSQSAKKRQTPSGRAAPAKKAKGTRPEMGMGMSALFDNGATKPPRLTKKTSASAKKDKKGKGGTSNRWTKVQDDALRKAVEVYGGRNWKAIAAMVDGRDHVQCLQRWKKVLQPGLVKGHWTPEEDDKLLRLIQDDKMHSWAMVADQIEGRTAKQCRERWSLNLDPSINRSPWTPEEDALLLRLHAKMGGKWAEIKGQFDGRTENSVKTRYKSLMRAKAREWTPEQDQKLIELRMKHGRNWAAIAKELTGRSRNAIKVRCKTLEYDGSVANGRAPARSTANIRGGDSALYLGEMNSGQANSNQAALTA